MTEVDLFVNFHTSVYTLRFVLKIQITFSLAISAFLRETVILPNLTILSSFSCLGLGIGGDTEIEKRLIFKLIAYVFNK